MTGHRYHATHGYGQCEEDVYERVHDHELGRARELASIVRDDAPDAAAEVEEDMGVDDDCSELHNEDPQVMKPKSFFLVVGGNPTLLKVSPNSSRVQGSRREVCLPILQHERSIAPGRAPVQAP